MKRLMHFASLVVFFIASFSNINAQTIIGNQSSTTQSNSYPINGYYEYGWSNSIYLQSEIATPSGGSLSSIAFYVNNSSSNCTLNNQKIYVRHTSETAYNNSTYVGTAGFTLVYDGSISFNGMGWKTINFTTPFAYNGTSNLEFLFENKNGTYSNYFPNFKTTATNSSTGATVYRTKRDYKITDFPSSCYSCAQIGYRPNIQLTIQPCAYNAGTVSTTTPSVFLGNSATLNLSGQSSGATIQWQSSADNLSFKNIIGATNPSYPATNLMETTYYRALVTFSTGCKYISNSTMVSVDISNLTTSSIGNGVATFDKYPFNGYYDYSWASMLYKSSEINSTGKLSRISFYVDNNPVNETMVNQKIYVRHTTTNEYTESAYPSTTGFTLVYDGSITYNGTGWKEIVLQNVFEYNGVDDLEFLFENKDGSWDNNYPIFRGQTGMSEYRVKRDFKLQSFPSTCSECGKFQNILNIKMKFIPCTINGGTLTSTSVSSRVGENVKLILSDQSTTGTIQWEQSSDNINFKLIAGQTGTSCSIPMTILPLYVRTVTKNGCNKYSNVVTVTPDVCFMANSSIGTGHSETEKYPFNVYYNNSWSNVIYTKKEIGSAGKIASLSFNVLNSPVNYITKNQTIYVRTKTDTVFTDSTYSGTTGFTKIFEGDITYNGAGWKEIPLTTPFDYDGVSNLEFLFENRDGSYGDSYPTFEYSSGTSGFRVKRDYYDDAFPLTCISCRKFQNIPNVKIKFFVPENLSGTVSATETEVCAGQTSELSIEGQVAGSTVQWQSSSDNVVFVNVNGAITNTYTTSEITATTYYRAVVSVGACSVNSSVVTVKFDGSIKMIIDETSGLGSIEVDIASIADKVGPYHYLISELPISELTEEYHYLRDTIYGDTIPVDSVAFFRGDQEATKFKFENIQIGNYYIAVFDSRGIRIFDKQKIVQPVFIFETGSGLVGRGTSVVSIQDNAKGTIEAYLTEETQGALKFVLSQPTKTQFYGLLSTETTLTDKTSLQYGFNVENGTIFTVENGIQRSTNTVASTNMELLLQQIDGNLKYIVGGKEMYSSALPTTEYILKSGFGFEKAGVSLTALIDKFKIKKYVFYKHITNGNCVGTINSMIGFSVRPTHFYLGTQVYHYTIYNGTTPVNSGSGYTMSSLPPFILPAGIYTILGTISIPGGIIPFSETIYLGNQTEWLTLANYSLDPNTYSLKKTASIGISDGRATNTLLSTDIGWVKFNPVMLTAPNLVFSHGGVHTLNKENYFVFSQNTSAFPSLPSFTTDTYFTFEKINSTSYRIRAKGYVVGSSTLRDESYSASFSYSAGTDVRVMIKATTLELWVNNVLKKTLARPTGMTRLKANSKNTNDGFAYIVASFCSPIQTLATIGYTELKKEASAGYALGLEGKAKFTFTEEYKIESGKFLPYKLYDDSHNLIASCSITGTVTGGAQKLGYNFDDNRYIMKLEGISGIIVNKYYQLEVETSTGEKRYLRIYYKN